jgi:hypothetical protein
MSLVCIKAMLYDASMLTIKGAELKAITVRLPDETYAMLAEDARRVGMRPGPLARAYLKMVVERRTDLMRIIEIISEEQPSLDADATIPAIGPSDGGRRRPLAGRGRCFVHGNGERSTKPAPFSRRQMHAGGERASA